MHLNGFHATTLIVYPITSSSVNVFKNIICTRKYLAKAGYTSSGTGGLTITNEILTHCHIWVYLNSNVV